MQAKDPLDAYFKINQGLYTQTLEGRLYGSRYIANGLVVNIAHWNMSSFPTLEEFGYPSQKKRVNRLKRNYFEEVSHNQARDLLVRKWGNTPYTSVPLSYCTNKIKQSGNLGCIVGGSLIWQSPNGKHQRLEADFLFRISETVKVLPADIVFLTRCIEYTAPPIMLNALKGVRLHFSGAYTIPGFFPQLVAMMYTKERLDEGIELKDNVFGRACIKGLEQAMDYEYKSKWKPQIRIINFFRRTVPKNEFSFIRSKVSLVSA
jgi:hypothetical protein